MPDIVGVRFRPCGKIYDFEVDGIETGRGDAVVVESDFGLGIGTVVRDRKTVDLSEQTYKKVLRRATEEDFQTKDENRMLEEDARRFCRERIMARGLPMKLVGAEATLDRRRIIFYFTADGRIDFRELVKDLAAKFRTRIEMRQIGIRDEAKMIGGLGICGRQLCCRTFLTAFEPISIKMAKKQELVLNVGKLSGLCSRLMCCLKYEYEGDARTVERDDEIPAGQEEVPIETIELQLDTARPQPAEQERKPRSRSRRREKRPEPPQESPIPTQEGRKAEPSRSGPQQEKEQSRQEGEGTLKRRPRGRRRRFKK